MYLLFVCFDGAYFTKNVIYLHVNAMHYIKLSGLIQQVYFTTILIS